MHETSRLCTVFTGTGTGAQGTFHPLPRGDFSLVYSCCSLITRLCLTLFYPMDWTDCSVHGILQARILDWVAISSSRGSFLTQGLNPCLLHWQVVSLRLSQSLCCSVMSNSLLPHDSSPPGFSVHGDSPGKNTGVGYHYLLQRIFPTQGLNSGIPHCR